ncbi:MAG TPA: hypothetical protein ENI20_09215 [Bacteroides sp.]|nr:hypothetical protein [Bacteroides sp.]
MRTRQLLWVNRFPGHPAGKARQRVTCALLWKRGCSGCNQKRNRARTVL